LQLVPLLPYYECHPVVADLNALYQDVDRYVGSGFTALTFLARHEAISLITSGHVRTRLPELLATKHVQPSRQLRAWREVYLPLVRFVEVPTSMCAWDKRIARISDPEDRPFAQVAAATAPSLLLTRDRHLLEHGLGTDRWAETLVILGDLIELDMAVHGSAHTTALLAWLAGQAARRAWRAATAEPLISLGVAGVALVLFLDNREELLGRAKAARAALANTGTRLLEASAPAFERRQRQEARLHSRLQHPLGPASVETVCARELAVRRGPRGIGHLHRACHAASITIAIRDLRALLDEHPSFLVARDDTWQLGELGDPAIYPDAFGTSSAQQQH
jgi:hypothetical protein